MKTEWDCSNLANAYLKRQDYSKEALDAVFARMDLPSGSAVCDIGVGAWHLTLRLAARGFDVTAVEPNDSMRALGDGRASGLARVAWRSHATLERQAGSLFGQVMDKIAAVLGELRTPTLDAPCRARIWLARERSR